MSFSRLLDDLARERDRRERGRNLAFLTEKIRADGRAFSKSMRALTAQASVMVKAMNVDMAQNRATQRQDAIDTLARINEKATAMAASGQLSAYEGALLDGAIAAAADRIRAL